MIRLKFQNLAFGIWEEALEFAVVDSSSGTGTIIGPSP
ncbi:uncharacterized protein G2W53_042501 [Senna tora]|uniref:Uncharacterized protein n=1 Tax=Senna tora TaxID=362788 RepID=A0A834VZY2_9FABA|nr:uncharacterized protein G2W53_042501 [Senna tora]